MLVNQIKVVILWKQLKSTVKLKLHFLTMRGYNLQVRRYKIARENKGTMPIGLILIP